MIARRALPRRGEPRLRVARRPLEPGYFRVDLAAGQERDARRLDRALGAVIAPSSRTRRSQAEHERRRAPARQPPAPLHARARAAELVLAADQFIITPAGRVEDAARAHAAGDEVRTVIAGYHWFTDWGRDTMISLEGLTLTHRPAAEAGYILRTFAHYVRDGLIPNLFPEGEQEGLYHTADATLWFFHALDRYLAATGDRATLRLLLPDPPGHRRAPSARHALRHRRRPGRRPAAPGRRGLSAHLDGRQGGRLGGDAAARQGRRDQRALVQRALPAGRLAARGARGGRRRATLQASTPSAPARRSTGASGTPDGGYLYDVVDGEHGDDPACRPNQLFAISLDAPGPRPRRAGQPVLEVVRERLLTPVGLRSLAPGSPTTSRTTTATCARATPPTTRGPSGPG